MSRKPARTITATRGEIRAEHIWKRFRADLRRGKLVDEFERIVARKRGAEGKSRHRWALRDVEMHVEPGASMALVGSNGSGKSTMLKVLTGIMFPTAGRVSAGGRIGAMIEVKSGIHPELSGRENIHLYGRVLGLDKQQIARRFDEIVEFAELEEAIDRQVKFYSSGMGMRLGFAVAAYLQPDILLVDEVLAVGDARFQQRCLDRMRQVLAEGTTLVYVSHDLTTIEAMCTDTVWLEQGVVRAVGPTRPVLSHYRQAVEGWASAHRHEGPVVVSDLQVLGPDGGPPRSGEPAEFRIVFDATEPHPASVYLGVSEGPAACVFVLHHELQLAAGRTEVRCKVDSLPLPGGRWYSWIGAFNGREMLHDWQATGHFDTIGPELYLPPQAVVRLAPVLVRDHWEHSTTTSGGDGRTMPAIPRTVAEGKARDDLRDVPRPEAATRGRG
jgi:ABC-type polysaccharide/polyol phosphate transport system ATPase subunit